MSVSQVKKRFAEMESYLGRDKEALRRLKLLKDDVNVLRTSLAAAEERAAESEVVKDAARKRADDAESSLALLRAECDRLSHVVAARDSRIAILESKPAEQEDRVDVDEEAEAKQMMRNLRKHMKYCPLQVSMGGKITKDTSWFNRNDFASGWSRKSIWMLGASVAVLTALSGQVVIFTDDTFRTMKKKNRCGSLVKETVQWFKNNIRKDGVDELWKSLTPEQQSEAHRLDMENATAHMLYGDDEHDIDIMTCASVLKGEIPIDDIDN